MQETVLLPYLVQYAPLPIQGGPAYRRERSEFQFGPPAVRELHQILVVVVPAALEHRVILVQVKLAQHPPLEVLWHTFIIQHPQRCAFLPAFQPFGYLLQDTVPPVVIYLHLGIPRELERISLHAGIFKPLENICK